MKRLLLSILCLACLVTGRAEVEVPRSISPEGEFVVMIETDKDQKGYRKLPRQSGS